MITQQILINNKTNSIIDAEKIFNKNENGIIVSNNNCLKGVPAENIKIQNEYEDNYYYSRENVPEQEFRVKTQPFYDTENEIKDGYVEKAHYRFGIKNIDFCNKTFYKNCAIISEYINVSNVDYITISSKEEAGFNSSVEYYIIDGTSEVPVLPEGIETVKNEKLFYGESTRFIVNNTQYNTELYEDDILSNKSYVDLTSNDFEQHEYTLSYIPGSDTHKYIPNNNNIKIKMIIRNYGTNFSPVVVSGVTVNKYGGSPEWI